jgi:hypothetical protein
MIRYSHDYPCAGVKVDMEYVGKVGETLDFVCRKDKKVFQTTEPDLKDNVLTIVCKPDKYYTVPSSGVSAAYFSL